MYCGFDFGTSNSAIAICEAPTSDDAQLLPLEAESQTVPSSLFYGLNGELQSVGRAAIASYMEAEPGRFMRTIKSLLGSSLISENTQIGARRVPLFEVLVDFLGELKRRAEGRLGRPLQAVMQGRPVYFCDDDHESDQLAERTLREALQRVGFEEIEFQLEPIAALRQYENQVEREALVLVADIGGGTSDFSLVKLMPRAVRGQSIIRDLLANHGVHIGGTDFDRKLSMRTVMPLLGMGGLLPGSKLPTPVWVYHDLADPARNVALQTRETLRQVRAITDRGRGDARFDRLATVFSERLAFRIAHDVEAAKVALSERERVSVMLDYLEQSLFAQASSEDLSASIERELQTMLNAIEECLKRAGTAPHTVDQVVLTGGSTEMPLVRCAIERHLPQARLVASDKFGAVAKGLALEAAVRWG